MKCFNFRPYSSRTADIFASPLYWAEPKCCCCFFPHTVCSDSHSGETGEDMSSSWANVGTACSTWSPHPTPTPRLDTSVANARNLLQIINKGSSPFATPNNTFVQWGLKEPHSCYIFRLHNSMLHGVDADSHLSRAFIWWQMKLLFHWINELARMLQASKHKFMVAHRQFSF